MVIMEQANELILNNFEGFHAIMRFAALAKNANKEERLTFLQEIYDMASKHAEENNNFLENTIN